MAKTATVLTYLGARGWRYFIQYRTVKLHELQGEHGVGTNANATLEAWLIINGFTHYRFGTNGSRRTL